MGKTHVENTLYTENVGDKVQIGMVNIYRNKNEYCNRIDIVSCDLSGDMVN